MTFPIYEKIKNTLIIYLDNLNNYAQQLSLMELAEKINTAEEKLKTDVFSLGIVGEFNAGKSSVINAYLRQVVLPTGILPTTAAINRIKYGAPSGAKIYFKHDDPHNPDPVYRCQEIPIQELSNYVTKLTEENEERALTIQEAEVSFNLPILMSQQLVIFDTPGLNDEGKMTEVTLSVLPNLDAAIMVLRANQAFSQSEKDFLEHKLLSADLGQVIFLVNQIDILDSNEVVQVLDHTKKQIQRTILTSAKNKYGEDSREYQRYQQKIGEIKVFGVSAKKYLQGITDHNPDVCAESKFEEFTQGLENFLTTKRAGIKLSVPLNDVIIFSCTEIIRLIEMRKSNLSMTQTDFEEACAQTEQELKTIEERQRAELALIQYNAKEIKDKVKPLLVNIPDILKAKIVEIIDNEPIMPNQLAGKPLKELNEKIGTKISNTIQNEMNKISEQVFNEIQDALKMEIERLQAFISVIDECLKKIDLQFNITPQNAQNNNVTGQVITAALSVFTGFGGIWGGYREAGVKGAVVGLGASFLTVITGGVIAGLLAVPISLPVVLGIGIISIFAGEGMARVVFPTDRIKNYKHNYKREATGKIDQENIGGQIQQATYDQIDEVYGKFQAQLISQVQEILDNTRNNLHQMRMDRLKKQGEIEAKLQVLAGIEAGTNQILQNSQRLAGQVKQFAA